MIDSSHTLSPPVQRDQRYPAPSRRICTSCGATQDTGPGIIETDCRLERPCGEKMPKPPVDPISVFLSPEGWGVPSRVVRVRPGSGNAVKVTDYEEGT